MCDGVDGALGNGHSNVALEQDMQNKVTDLQDELVERMEENAKELKRRDRSAQDSIGEKMDARNREMSRFQRENKFLEKRLLELQEELQEAKRIGAFTYPPRVRYRQRDVGGCGMKPGIRHHLCGSFIQPPEAPHSLVSQVAQVHPTASRFRARSRRERS